MTKPTNLNDFLLEYCAAFRPGNIPEVAKYYHLPVTMIFGGQVAILTSEQQVIDTLQTIMDKLINSDFHRSRLDLCHIHELTKNTALLSASFSRLNTDDEILEQIGATYTVIKIEEGYKIAVLVAHETQTVIATQTS